MKDKKVIYFIVYKSNRYTYLKCMNWYSKKMDVLVQQKMYELVQQENGCTGIGENV